AGALLATAERVGTSVTLAPLRADSAALDAGLVVSTLPGAAADAVAGHRWHAGQAVLDVVYSPWPTRLARGAADGGAVIVSGTLRVMRVKYAPVGSGRQPGRARPRHPWLRSTHGGEHHTARDRASARGRRTGPHARRPRRRVTAGAGPGRRRDRHADAHPGPR